MVRPSETHAHYWIMDLAESHTFHGDCFGNACRLRQYERRETTAAASQMGYVDRRAASWIDVCRSDVYARAHARATLWNHPPRAHRAGISTRPQTLRARRVCHRHVYIVH